MESASFRLLDCLDCRFVYAFALHAGVMLPPNPIEVNVDSEIITRGEEMQFSFQQNRIRAEVNKLFARDQPFDNFPDLRMY